MLPPFLRSIRARKRADVALQGPLPHHKKAAEAAFFHSSTRQVQPRIDHLQRLLVSRLTAFTDVLRFTVAETQ